MSLTRKFVVILVISILLIAITNIVAFYIFYGFYLEEYFSNKADSKESVTIDYINSVIEKQTIDDIDSIFEDTELEFFELLDDYKGLIPLNDDANVDVVIKYLIKSGVSPKYIEELIPTDNFREVIKAFEDKNSPEYKFVSKLTTSIVITNFFAVAFIIFLMLVFTRKTIRPIKDVTKKIRLLKPGQNTEEITYHNKTDEIGLLITSINGLNKRLVLQENIRNRLLADISHELKTPITSIQCYLEGISDGVIKLNSKNLGSITSEMERLIKLVNKIMEYEKFDRQSLVVELIAIDLVDLIKQTVETHKKRLKENKQRIKVSGVHELYSQADKNLFTQLVHNIIGNFLKYAGKKSQLTINITRNYIDFTDNGTGIKASEVQFITEKFYQGNIEKSGDASNRGIGIGLSIVKKIIESHNWKSEIKSDVGKGFSLKIYLKHS